MQEYTDPLHDVRMVADFVGSSSFRGTPIYEIAILPPTYMAFWMKLVSESSHAGAGIIVTLSLSENSYVVSALNYIESVSKAILLHRETQKTLRKNMLLFQMFGRTQNISVLRT